MRESQQMRDDGGAEGVCISSTGGPSVERLTTSPHYCLLEHTPKGEEERIKKG